ncbi:MAG: CoA transferase [Alicyclobacillus macrosporangiidus]|uniref:CaiB/BaiF CoA transferase family protein n=1 Tax=Alicyclobacillus macrosporangiidus TaxID=392015 RepID=UPI0026EA64A5|nr:CaiB/BaiF CoA-transferase family protein [Alicyclobacillus macrosporangiidus]MCL6597539.1 CoA transferase [Alicyclobacillus macrosporangiidus]
MTGQEQGFPLQGITVVSLEQAVAAPFATRQLADLGARVIKVERPGGGDFARYYDTAVKGLSSHFVWINRSKESITLNLKHPVGQTVLGRLLDQADVLVSNLSPGALDRMGFDKAALEERFPHLIVCEISGYGRGGPYEGRKAYDLLIQCEAGLLSVTGTEETPCKAGIAVADIAAGMYAFSSILAALWARQHTEKGVFIEISMLEALGEWMGFPYYYAMYGGSEPPRTGSSHATICPYGAFTTGDGRRVFLAVQNDREWDRFCDVVLERPALASDPRYRTNPDRLRHRADLEQEIQTIVAELTAEALMARLDAAKIANAPLNSVVDFAHHPQLRARGRWHTVETPAGPVQAMALPIHVAQWPVRMDPVPDAGQHTERILAELGFSREEVAGWRSAQIV